MSDYCTARIHHFGPIPDEIRVERLESFEALVALLEAVREQFAALDDDWGSEGEGHECEPPEEFLGGFGVQVTNRWGGEVEVAAGRDAWFLFRQEPEPGICFSDRPPIDGARVFYLDGGHHTELEAEMLASREGCLRVLRAWLDKDEFPESERRSPRTP